MSTTFSFGDLVYYRETPEITGVVVGSENDGWIDVVFDMAEGPLTEHFEAGKLVLLQSREQSRLDTARCDWLDEKFEHYDWEQVAHYYWDGTARQTIDGLMVEAARYEGKTAQTESEKEQA
ncbi:hypothetical protein [Neisseria mucosa]|jgi:hypothetical protein|uniref:hypothetical protein n=1 Tax=Neisseria mucosa TaxID=488 RepID=UPI000D36EB4A|nr:hypothetical protein [Neisseria mucosa]